MSNSTTQQWLPFIKKFGFILIAGGLLFCQQLNAEDRALLIGIGRYKHSTKAGQKIDSWQQQGALFEDLPGIDKDIEMMQDISLKMGFQPAQIIVLRDEQATKSSIESVFHNWLGQVSENDRVLIYFSGHGSRVKDVSGDEKDGLDEILVAHDFVETDTVAGYISDDEFGQWLAKIPSKKILAIIDACYSGTITRSRNLDENGNIRYFGVPKFVVHKGNPYRDFIERTTGDRSFVEGSQAAVNSNRFLALTASAADQESQATENGSLFTLGLYRAVENAIQASKGMTPKQWLQAAQQFIQGSTLPAQFYTPQFEGAAPWKNEEIVFKKITQPQAVDFNSLEEMVNKSAPGSADLDIKVYREYRYESSDFMTGDYMTFEVSSPKTGYVYLFERDQRSGKVRILFPNDWDESNLLQAGKTLTIAGKDAKRKLLLQEAEQDETVYYVLQQPHFIPFNSLAEQELDKDGKAKFYRLLDASTLVSKGSNQVDTYLKLKQIRIKTCNEFQSRNRC